MKLKIEIDENIEEDEILIKCKSMNENINEIQKYISKFKDNDLKITFYKDDIEYYISIYEILFFESSDDKIVAHTKDELYMVKFRLYELEEILPFEFIRVSKSTIVNVKYIFSVDKNIASASVVEFRNSHKKVYISRKYFNEFKARLEKVRG